MTSVLLLTGATGHIGFRTLLYALQAGYRVRAAVRSQAKAEIISSHPLIQSLKPGSRLSFAIVPDLTTRGAYDDAAKGVSFIIHIASPLALGEEVALNEQDAYFIRPAVRGTRNILEAARRAGTVRRVVITSSLVALLPLPQLNGEEMRYEPVRPTDRIKFEEGPYETEFAAYAASKVAALEEAESWMEQTRPKFDLVHLHPSFVEGRNDLANNARDAMKGTNGLVLGLALGKQFENPIAGATVHNDDVARAHVQALDGSVCGNTSYILSQPMRWNDAIDIVRREFPGVMLPDSGNADTNELPIDVSATEQAFGLRFLGFEEQVKSVVGHYLELRSRGRKVVRKDDTRKDSVVDPGTVSMSVRASA